jgi:hypothetical protein
MLLEEAARITDIRLSLVTTLSFLLVRKYGSIIPDRLVVMVVAVSYLTL